MVEAEVDPRLEAAEIHRRVIAAGRPGAPVHAACAAPTSRSSPTSSAPRAGPSSPSAGGRGGSIRRLVELAETLMPPTAGKLWGARDLGCEALRIGLAAPRERAR